MTETEHLLSCLAEECAEVAQQCSKALRFGLAGDGTQPTSPAERIVEELHDVYALVEHLTNEGVLPRWSSAKTDRWIDQKRTKVLQLLKKEAS